ncbi:hypothetical protein HZA57_07525 [Candidatus Poribacteria bacterium]|nr:hypothetical protein [Candidatus Poribacteria bacterium]
MKSKQFTRYELGDPERFAGDLGVALSVPDGAVCAVVAALPKLLASRTALELSAALDALATCAGLRRDVLQSTIAQVFFFARALRREPDPEAAAEAWSRDLIELGVLPPQSAADFARFVERLGNIPSAHLDRPQVCTASAEGLLPTLQSVETAVELREIGESELKAGRSLDSPISGAAGAVPVVSVRIGLDSGAVREIVFESLPEQLKLLRDGLDAAIQAASQFGGRSAVDSAARERRRA